MNSISSGGFAVLAGTTKGVFLVLAATTEAADAFDTRDRMAENTLGNIRPHTGFRTSGYVLFDVGHATSSVAKCPRRSLPQFSDRAHAHQYTAISG